MLYFITASTYLLAHCNLAQAVLKLHMKRCPIGDSSSGEIIFSLHDTAGKICEIHTVHFKTAISTQSRNC